MQASYINDIIIFIINNIIVIIILNKLESTTPKSANTWLHSQINIQLSITHKNQNYYFFPKINSAIVISISRKLIIHQY